jgi:WbqC-like protein family
MSIVFPIAYFGPIAYYRQLVSSKQFFIEQHETYVKQTIRNRTTIYSSNGPLDLSIPVKKVFGNKTITKDIQISYDEDWIKNHWKALESAYMHTPYFEHYGSEVFQLISSKETSLLIFNLSILNSIIKWLDLDVYFNCTESYSKNVGEDFRTFNFNQPNVDDKTSYYQVFSGNHGYIPNLSLLDLLFHEGPLARKYLYV